MWIHVMLLPALERAGRAGARFKLSLAPQGYVVEDRSDLIVLEETLINEDFDLSFDTPHVIVDLGAHAGSFVIKLRSRYPAARVVAVEPAPRTFSRLTRNVGGLPGVTPVNAAVSDKDGEASFTEERLSWGSRLSPTGGQTVETMTLARLRARYQLPLIDVLKVDIEGAEWDVLRSDADLDGVRHVLIELHGGDLSCFLARFPAFESRVARDFGHAWLVQLDRRRPVG